MSARIAVPLAWVALVAALMMCVLLAASPPNATARSCGTINLGGVKIFTKHNMRCETAKHYARHLYKTDGQDPPRHFKCSSGSNFNDGAFCEHFSKDKYFGWHPAD